MCQNVSEFYRKETNVDACFDDSKYGGYNHFNFLAGEKTMSVAHYISPGKYKTASQSNYLSSKKPIYVNGNIVNNGEVGKTYYLSIAAGYEEYELNWSLSNDNAEIVSYSLDNHRTYRYDHKGNRYRVYRKGIEIKLKKPGEITVICEVKSENGTSVTTTSSIEII